jgi:hypothetical protein
VASRQRGTGGHRRGEDRARIHGISPVADDMIQLLSSSPTALAHLLKGGAVGKRCSQKREKAAPKTNQIRAATAGTRHRRLEARNQLLGGAMPSGPTHCSRYASNASASKASLAVSPTERPGTARPRPAALPLQRTRRHQRVASAVSSAQRIVAVVAHIAAGNRAVACRTGWAPRRAMPVAVLWPRELCWRTRR